MPFADIEHVELCYEVKGNPKDPAIILIMGFGGQLIQWPPALLQTLVDAGYRVVTFDNRDAGLTRFKKSQPVVNLQEVFNRAAKGEKLSLPYTLADMAEDVIQLMDSLHIQKANILGMSVGGMIVQLLAIHYPERLESLVCVSSSSGDTNLPPPTPAVQETLMNFTQGSSEGEEDHVKNRIELYKLYNPSFSEGDLENTSILAQKEYHRRISENSLSRQILAVTTAPPRVDGLKNLTIPALILHGTEDPVFPLEHGMQLYNLIKGSHFHEVNHMGHGFTQKAVELLRAELTDFYRSI